MLDKLAAIEERYVELGEKSMDMEVINDRLLFQKIMKEHSDIEPLVFKYREFVETRADRKSTRLNSSHL